MVLGIIGLGLSAVSTGMGLFGQKEDNYSQYNAVYASEMGRYQTEIENRRKLEGNRKALGRTIEQVQENRDALYRAFSETQAANVEQMYGFAMAKQSAIRERILAESAYQNVERYGRSAQRVKNLGVLGEYGRNNAIFAETVSSSQHKFRRDMLALAKQGDAAQRKAVTDLEGYLDSQVPSLVGGGYVPYNSNNNGLAIAGQAIAGFADLAMQASKVFKTNDGRSSGGGNPFASPVNNTNLAFSSPALVKTSVASNNYSSAFKGAA